MENNLFHFSFNNPHSVSTTATIKTKCKPQKKVSAVQKIQPQPKNPHKNKHPNKSHFTISDGQYFLEAKLARREGKLKQGFLFFKRDIFSATLSLNAGGGRLKYIRAYILSKEGREITVAYSKTNSVHSIVVDYKHLRNNELKVLCEAKIKSQGVSGYKILKSAVSLGV